MVVQNETEEVPPDEIAEGDEICDQLGMRWLTVTEIQVAASAGGGVYSFYGGGPRDRVTFEGHELVRRRTR
jgi:hypothetical protein